ncbi:MAG: energy-coupling factor ABC transporter permease [Victivallaceae bacterium]|nr:energy-coupling factor ABC transporter permease [Victivallaceae bacterium]
MHMADALISPGVSGLMWAASAGALGYSVRKINQFMDDSKIPLMGVMGAFIFAAQMINFTIPGTGSSGHICGSLLLAVILGPYAALLVIASVLVVQALIFADGGLLALGCNIFNIGVIPCLLAYPLIYRTIVCRHITGIRLWSGSVITAIISLQLGAFAVVLETLFSGISELPFTGFVLLMQPIHLAIGLVEGLLTASVLILIKNARPEILTEYKDNVTKQRFPIKGFIITIILTALIIGGIGSWFASARPDGLEWSIAGVTDNELSVPAEPLHQTAAKLQQASSILPGYGFKTTAEANNETRSGWGEVNSGSTVSGLVGIALTLLLAAGLGIILKQRFKQRRTVTAKGR